MRTSRPPATDGGSASSRRTQPVRQTRVNPPRTSSLNRANPLAGAPAPEQPINILPGVTHFADAITALPKELVRHFTLLKEVDAKIFAPEAALFQLLHDALNTPAPDFTRTLNGASSSATSVSANANAQNNSTVASNPPAPPSDSTAASVFDPANLPRRALFHETALKIQGMMVALEEKNHLIATANDALQKQLSRIESIWPHLEAEFSDEAKWGSTTHWAYVENRQAKANDKQAERSRREGAATLSAAAQQLAEEAAARSNDRKQALAAKKNAKNHAADGVDGDKAQESGKKAQGGGKSRKPLPDSGPVGLGIRPAPAGTAPPNKKRKVEAAKPNGGAVAERAMSTVFGNNASKQRTTSPRETPAPENGPKKRKALPTSSNQAKKRQRPPSTASNKPNGNPQETPDPNQPSNGANTDSKAQKEAPLSVVDKPDPSKPEAEEPVPAPEPTPNGSRKESAAKPNEEREQPKKEAASLAIQPAPAPMVKTKSGRASKPSTPAIATFAEAASSNVTATTTTSRSRPSRNGESGASSTTSTATTNSTTTPNNSSSSTATAATTNTTSSSGATAKRSHKKGASVSATAAAVAQAAQQAGGASAAAAADREKEKDKEREPSTAKKDKDKDGGNARHQNNHHRGRADVENEDEDEDDDEDGQDNADEDLYCYCNQVSYGEMVACDGEGCPREWFHLECVGLKVAPKVNAKWYCEDCKKRLKIAERR
ncbi:267d2e45-42eb-452b-bd7f-b193068cad51 [Thermothielavioides terrestris]|uniref:Chromatin modification-related protein n=1 Tax=Thermothielavioides terrestris TaxID=2587410 RepID=A0A3S4AQM3_9PEZI|nr:267d2e45-42eb-452b-bd7f-b193068cad51 [Thermothielavioides terrestris]